MSAAPAADDRDWSAADYGRHAGFVIDQAADLIDWLAPRAGERVLDLGCGDGLMSRRLAERGVDVTGIDASPAMVEAAVARGVSAHVVDAQALSAASTLATDYDAVFSNAAIHWMARAPDAVLQSVYARLKAGGRFVAEFGGEGNIAPLHAALRDEAAARGHDADPIDPWFFPSEADYRRRLVRAGFTVERCVSFERPTPLAGELADWIYTLARPFVTAFDAGAARDDYVAAVVGRLRPTLSDAQGHWQLPYVRLRFVARKPD
ncbi:methyltransferase domain-containing protein [uncultured Salinisphaera sp.]|uniref:class I SAM-dependent methyltransferase n=1 Tax=uncultured Salinisphaera sp. TaxID=359372 RepID=UPI0032B1A6D3